jgi:GNAT superfamily N-acetyltransferase
MQIRTADPGELTTLREIELAAGQVFREVGMAAVADYLPMSVAELEKYRLAGRAWVAANPEGGPVAYLIAEVVDGCLHIDQVSVHPGYARRGVGRELIEYTAERAAALGLPALTLTTFVEVPWNGPYYARCGFRTVPVAAETPGLRAIRDREAALGLDRWARTCMRRDL